MPKKIGLNLSYAAEANVATDFLVILRTLGCLLNRSRVTPDEGETVFQTDISETGTGQIEKPSAEDFQRGSLSDARKNSSAVDHAA